MNAQDHLARTRAALEALDPQAIDQAGMALVHALDRGGMIYTCGNGGSAAEALHLVEEVIGCYSNRARPARAAVCLNADPTTMTCIANEFGYENIFSRQLEALLRQEDILIVLSTSGESRNIINALQVARETGTQTIGLLGRGGSAAELCDTCLLVPVDQTAAIQEAHLAVVHCLCAAIEHHTPVPGDHA
jgi:D-sedoheptulose 7-phosphate isomerase